jgi:hypothetical protein
VHRLCLFCTLPSLLDFAEAFPALFRYAGTPYAKCRLSTHRINSDGKIKSARVALPGNALT